MSDKINCFIIKDNSIVGLTPEGKEQEYLVIPNSVTSIGENAFKKNKNLKTVTFEENSELIAIYGSAFKDCTSLQKIVNFANCHQLKYIGGWAFSGCYSLTSITIPKSVESIEPEAFSCSIMINSITFEPDSHLKEIGAGAFQGCTLLESITIPKNVKKIDVGAFLRCLSLQKVTFEKGSKLEEINIGVFNGCSSLKNIFLTDEIKNISPLAFASCDSLQSITIPASVTSIGETTFINCSPNAKYYVPNNQIKQLLLDSESNINPSQITLLS